MIRACLAVTLTLASLALAAEPASPCSTTVPDPFFGDSTPREGLALPDGPISVGYFEADMATGRRTCPRTEVGIGGRFGAIIDTPNFYGNLGVNGLIFGSYALNEKTEVFATLEAVSFDYAVTPSGDLGAAHRFGLGFRF